MSRSLTKPVLGLAVGAVLGLLDGLSGFFAPELAGKMAEVVGVSMGKGLLCGILIGLIANRWQSLLFGIVVGIAVAGALSYVVVLRAGPALLWDIMLPGMLLGAIVGFATQKFGRIRNAPDS
jgi:hypothetical protein